MDFNTGLRWKVQLQSIGGPMVGEPPPQLALGLPRRVPHVPGFLGRSLSHCGGRATRKMPICGITFPSTLTGGFQFWYQSITPSVGANVFPPQWFSPRSTHQPIRNLWEQNKDRWGEAPPIASGDGSGALFACLLVFSASSASRFTI